MCTDPGLDAQHAPPPKPTAEKNIMIRKWMDLENIILSEVTQTQKDKYHMYSLVNGFKTKNKKKSAYNSQSQRT